MILPRQSFENGVEKSRRTFLAEKNDLQNFVCRFLLKSFAEELDCTPRLCLPSRRPDRSRRRTSWTSQCVSAVAAVVVCLAEKVLTLAASSESEREESNIQQQTDFKTTH